MSDPRWPIELDFLRVVHDKIWKIRRGEEKQRDGFPNFKSGKAWRDFFERQLI